MPLLPGPPRRLGSHHVDGAAVDRRHDEGAQGASAGIELLGVVPEPEEHLLDDLLGQGPVVEDPDREPERGVAVAAVGLAQRFLAEPGDRHHQGGIARVAQVLLHGGPLPRDRPVPKSTEPACIRMSRTDRPLGVLHGRELPHAGGGRGRGPHAIVAVLVVDLVEHASSSARRARASGSSASAPRAWDSDLVKPRPRSPAWARSTGRAADTERSRASPLSATYKRSTRPPAQGGGARRLRRVPERSSGARRGRRRSSMGRQISLPDRCGSTPRSGGRCSVRRSQQPERRRCRVWSRALDTHSGTRLSQCS